MEDNFSQGNGMWYIHLKLLPCPQPSLPNGCFSMFKKRSSHGCNWQSDSPKPHVRVHVRYSKWEGERISGQQGCFSHLLIYYQFMPLPPSEAIFTPTPFVVLEPDRQKQHCEKQHWRTGEGRVNNLTRVCYFSPTNISPTFILVSWRKCLWTPVICLRCVVLPQVFNSERGKSPFLLPPPLPPPFCIQHYF